MTTNFFGLAVTLLFAGVLAPLFFIPSLPSDNYPKNPDIDIQHYRFEVRLSDQTNEIEVTTTVVARFKKAGISQLRFDLIQQSDQSEGRGMQVESVWGGAQAARFTHRDDQLFIDLAEPSTVGKGVQLRIQYRGTPATGLQIAPNKYGDRTFFSDNWPNNARHWLATVDHPYDKATCEFIVTAPSHYQVVSNGLLIEETDLEDGRRLTHWKQSVPIATWLYALGVARFAVQHVDFFEGKSIQTWVYRQDREAGFYDFAVPTKQALEFFSDYVGPFAYEKLANIQSNSVGGGMEAATAIFYGDRSVSGTRNKRWRNVIIHEVAHQWFGNAVTEYDWDDVWLSEGFATYFTLLFVEHAYGHDEFVEGLRSSRDRVFAYYQDHPDYRIVHDNLQDMSQVTSSQTYQKGAWTLHMLRSLVGDEAFRAGIQDYYREHINGNATTADFQYAMESASGLNLDDFFQQWLYQGGNIRLEGSWRYNASQKHIELELAQIQRDGYSFKVPVEVGIYQQGRALPDTVSLQLDGLQDKFLLPAESKPDSVVLDPRTVLLAQWTITEK